MTVNLLVAASENNVIGKDNRLLWHLPADLAFFKNITWGMPVIMGRKTFESLGKPLRGRTNIIVSRNATHFTARPHGGAALAVNGAEPVFVTGIPEAIAAAVETDSKECFIIGGGDIFRQSMTIANRIYMTRVLTNIEGDTFFPEIDASVWELKRTMPFSADEKHAFGYRFETWEKK